MILVVCWFELQVRWLSIDLRFKRFGCQPIWDSNESVVNWFEIQVIWLSIDLRFKWFGCQSIWDSNELVVNWFEIQAIWMSNGLRLKWFGCQLMSESNDFVKRSFSVRLPSKMKLWSSKTKLLCETFFKNEALKLKNEAFLRQFLQKWHVRHLTSEFQYVLTIFKWVLQKYCACHEKVEPRHTKSCNCHAKWSLQSNTSVTWNLQPFHGFCVGSFKHRHHKARNHCACHAKRIVSDPLQIHHACQPFSNPHELLRLPRILQPVEIPALATQKAFWTSK